MEFAAAIEPLSGAFPLLAQAAPGGGALSSFMLPLILVGIVYFVMIRPQQREQKAVEAMLAALQKGDRVVTTSGIHGTVAEVKDGTLLLEIADRLTITIEKAAIRRKVEPEPAKAG
jgi:preprotein translocase subunit YajC